uniref:Si:ch211-218d20.15 n=1 Tax=Paramormyrops kingsleyae TaxID=1676925 RepID=A0A3B3RNB4_9TELE
MAAVSITEPLCQPCAYDAKFKVELHVRKPLLSVHLSSEQVGLEMLCLCSQLDLLIRAQFQEQLNQDLSPEESDSFQREAQIIERMYLCLEHLPEPAPQLEDYLDAVGLSAMFPRVEVFIIHGSPVDMLEKPAMDYFPHIARLNQVLVLSQQLEDDVKHLGSHKYVAHQLSVLYQVLSTFKGIMPLSVLKRDIEANFKQLKMALVTDESSKQEPLLPAQYVN